MHTPTHKTQRPRQHMRARRAGPLTVTLVTVAVFAAACAHGSSGPGLAAAGSSSATGSSSPSSSASSDPLAFARCMRTHGVTDYPDSDGPIQPSPGSDLDPDNPTYQAARQACQSLLPTHSTTQQAQQYANGLKYSKCMRQHGITNYPDPDPHGGPGGHGGINLNGLGIDRNSPQFQAAQQACQHYLGGAGK